MFKFKKPKNELELLLKQGTNNNPTIPDEMYTSCPICKVSTISSDLFENLFVCPKCGNHYKITARQRIAIICDKDTFIETEKDLETKNILLFPEYDNKIASAKINSSEKEAVITGSCEIQNEKCAIFVMESAFMMGSMGSVVGEKITRLFEFATKNSLPVVGFTCSGGARMQEGIVSLMQMAKTSGAVKLHHDKGLLYITVLTNPTTGGVTASFAMQGDIIISEPNALICFAGPRVIEQTTRQKLPSGFQHAEFLLDKGFIDAIINRRIQKEYIGNLLKLHKKTNAEKLD